MLESLPHACWLFEGAEGQGAEKTWFSEGRVVLQAAVGLKNTTAVK